MKLIPALAIVFLVSMSAHSGTTLRITSRASQRGNIFLEGEKVQFMITAENLPSGAELRMKSLNLDGKVAASATTSRYGGGRAVAEAEFGVQQRGHYRVKAEVVKEGKIVSEGESTYAVIVAPEKRTYRESSPFAIDVAASWFFSKKEDLETASRLVRLAGISCVRDRFRWREIEPEKGAFRPGRYETSARIQHEAGLSVYQIFHDCPPWASGKRDSRYPSENPSDMGDFFRRMVSHFKDRVTYWEIWNEPDIDVFYLGTPEQYAACLKEAYRQIKQADPDAKVLLCSFSQPPGNFAERVLRAGIADSFDIYNIHYYGYPQGVEVRLKSHRQLMEKHGVRKPIWITEMGDQHAEGKGDHPTLRAEATYLVKAYVYGLANGAERFFYFIFSHYPERGRVFGTVNRDFTPRPAYVALCNLTYMLGEGKFVRKVDALPEGVECHQFRDGDQVVDVFWAKEAQQVRFPIEEGRKPQEAVDVVGRPISFRTFSDGTCELAVGPEPVFLK